MLTVKHRRRGKYGVLNLQAVILKWIGSCQCISEVFQDHGQQLMSCWWHREALSSSSLAASKCFTHYIQMTLNFHKITAFQQNRVSKLDWIQAGTRCERLFMRLQCFTFSKQRICIFICHSMQFSPRSLWRWWQSTMRLRSTSEIRAKDESPDSWRSVSNNWLITLTKILLLLLLHMLQSHSYLLWLLTMITQSTFDEVTWFLLWCGYYQHCPLLLPILTSVQPAVERCWSQTNHNWPSVHHSGENNNWWWAGGDAGGRQRSCLHCWGEDDSV